MKNYNKLITLIFTVIFITVFSIYNFPEYKEFHQNKLELEQKKLSLKTKLENFELDDIKNIKNIQFYNTPNKNLLTKIVKNIEEAENEIFLEVYMLTEKRIQNALMKSHNRGIKIKIILEKDPYKAYNINNKAYNKLEKAGIDIVWGDKSDYSLNHSKVLIIDNLSIISTGNLSYSTFTKNRDFFIFTNDENINTKLKENFINDYNGTKINIYDDNLIFSPNSSKIKFEKMFNSAKKDIKMYFQYMKDDDLVKQLIKIKENKDINIIIIIPETASDDENIKLLEKSGIKIKILSKYKMHAKAILIDETYLFIGSINMSNYSLEKNREVGILIKNTEIINKFLEVFRGDIKK